MANLETGLLVFLVFLAIHVIGVLLKWYEKLRYFDVLTHFLGGISLSIFIKNFTLAFFLILTWEVVEMALVVPGKKKFREDLPNKLRDLFFGIAGYLIGIYWLGA